MLWLKHIAYGIGCALLACGCASIDLTEGFGDVAANVKQRAGVKLFWNNGTEADREVQARLSELLQQELTDGQAGQIALLNNRELQAVYSDLGVAQADLVQAGLLKNPLFDAAVTFPVRGGRADLELTAVMSFLDIFYAPLRKRVAANRYEEAKSRVAGAALDLAGQVRSTFFTHQADQQMLELRQSIVETLAASMDVAQRLYQAGNLSDLDYLRERVLLENARLRLRGAETSARQSREQVNILLGLWGRDTEWAINRRLAELPKDALKTNDIESLAISASVDLAQNRQRIAVAGEQLGFSRATALAFDLDGGPRGERGDGAWAMGPVIEVPIPLFDQGQARIGRAASELRRAEQEYYALAVRVRATARAVADRLTGARDRALYYRDVVLPLQERVVTETQLHYNAMQLGPDRLLRAREQQIEAATGYVEALRDYWFAHSDYQQLLIGRLPQPGATLTASAPATQSVANGMGH